MASETATGGVHSSLTLEEAGAQLTTAVTRLSPPFPWAALPGDAVRGSYSTGTTRQFER